MRRGLPVVALATVAAVGHVLYPLWLAARSRGVIAERPPDPGTWVPVTAIVPAYREEGIIAAKVADLEANGYPGDLSVLVVADDPLTAAAARKTSARVLGFDERLGKAEALNRAVAATSDPIVVCSDANTLLEPGSIERLVRWFESPHVGAVAGEKRVTGRQGESLYWRFESMLKQRETRLGTTIGLVGELFAIRPGIYRPLPTDLVVDDLWLALDVIEQGFRVIYEPTACATEEGSPTLAIDWERRTRVVAGTLDVLWRRRALLRPGGAGVAAQLWGHRLIRSGPGPLSHALLLALALRRRRDVLPLVFVAGHLAAAAALACEWRGVRLPRPARIAAQVAYLQAVGLAGTIRYLRRDLSFRWEKPAR